MTCAEFHAFCERHPLTLTGAERTAAFHHYLACPGCHAEFVANVEQGLARMTPEQITAVNAEGKRIAAKDRADPELFPPGRSERPARFSTED